MIYRAIILLTTVFMASCTHPSAVPPTYPSARVGSQVDRLHGVDVPDPYRWMENLDDSETRRWIEAQNGTTFGYLKQIPQRQAIRDRLVELWNYPKHGMPFKRGGRYFMKRNDGLQNQSILYWAPSLDEKPRVLLDPNGLSKDGTMALHGYAVSEDGRYLAYGLSDAGSDWQQWRVREIDTGKDLSDHLKWIKFSGASWTHDNKGFFYSRYDRPAAGKELKSVNRNQRLFYHRIGTPQSQDALVYERPDHDDWKFGAKVSEDGRYLILGVYRGTSRRNRVFYRDLSGKGGPVVELLAEADANYSFIGNDGPTFYFRTDLNAPLSKIIAIDTRKPARSNWKTVVPESTDALQSVSFVSGRLTATYLHDASSRVKIFSKSGKLLRTVDLPGIGSVWGFSGRQADRETFFGFQGLMHPPTLFRYDMQTGKATVYKTSKIDVDPDRYVTRQVFYKSKDGTRVPMFITHRKGLKLDGSNGTYLYGYGGFNIALTPRFSIARLVWMEMGGVYAQPSLRGGGEYGRAWHQAGTKLQKQNVFDDFIAAAEWLIEHGYTRPDKLAIGGGSNGGLLVGAVMTQRPDLFGACVPSVGVLDMLRFHKFTIGWGWTSDYGSPDNADEFKALLAYSPYHNIRSGTRYPPTLIMTGDHDDRVFPAHSFKFAARLQAAQAGSAPVLIRIETRAGHGAGRSTQMTIANIADRWAFLSHVLGMTGNK